MKTIMHPSIGLKAGVPVCGMETIHVPIVIHVLERKG